MNTLRSLECTTHEYIMQYIMQNNDPSKSLIWPSPPF